MCIAGVVIRCARLQDRCMAQVAMWLPLMLHACVHSTVQLRMQSDGLLVHTAGIGDRYALRRRC